MDNLSELSKPVAWTDERGNLCTNRNKERGLESRYHQDYEKYTTPFYSQEYVSALLAELKFEKQNNAGVAGMVEDYETKLEAKDKRIAELEGIEQKLCAANVTLDARASAAEAKLATPVRLPALLQPERDAVNEMIFANGRNEAIAECSVAIRHAGFLSEASPMTIEGDE